MNADEPTPEDERCASLLAACHEAERAGETASPMTSPEVPHELRPRLERNLACARLLDQAWPREAVAGGADTPSWADGTSGPNASQVPSTIGRFRVRRELGRGGYGIVFQAYDPQLGREVALKVPRAEVVLTPELRERFLREARAAAVLDHPNLVPVYDAGEVGPVCYIASAYCPGTTLEAWLKAHAEPVPWQEAAALVATLAEAVHHAHANGVVHRDLKPANILLSSGGWEVGVPPLGSGAAPPKGGTPTSHPPLAAFVPKITDFGLAKFLFLEPGEGLQFQTQSGAIVGTPRNMAPEQAVGSSGAVGPTVDVHALGAILYEVLTGRPPFVAETVLDTLEQVRSHEPLAPSRLRPRLPRDLETICLRCLQKEPAKRYLSAGELAEDLRRFLAGEPIRARPVRAWERVVKWARRRPAAAALVAVSSLASLLLLAGLVVGIIVIADKQGQTEEALRREKEAREEIEQTSYLNGITSAFHEISARNWGRAEELLQMCPAKLRAWEWHYLKRLRRTPLLDPLPVGERVNMITGFDLAFHPDSRLLAIPSSSNRLQVWDASSGRKRLTIGGHARRVLGVAFSPDGRRLASTSEDRTVKVWDVSAGLGKGELREPVFTGRHEEPVIGVAFSPDGQRLASASGEIDRPGEVKVWDATRGKLLWSFSGQARPEPLTHLAFSPDGHKLASGSLGNKVKVWDVTTGQELYAFSGHTAPILNVTFSPDGRRLISAGRDRRVNVWDLEDAGRGLLAARWTLLDFSLGVWCMALSPDGSRLAFGGPTADGNVRVYDLTTGSLLHKLRGDIRVVSVAFSRDGRRLAAAGHDRIVRLWDTATGQEVLRLRGHKDIVGRVLFSPDGQRLASASADGTVRIWDASPFQNTDPCIRTLGGDDGEFFGLAFSPDGRLLASASADHFVKLWDPKTGQEVLRLRGHKEAALCVDFSSDGRRLLSGSMDKTVKLWDVQTAQELPLPGCGGFNVMVRSVAFRPDGRAFATGAHQRVQLWDLTGRPLLLPLKADPEFVNCVAFSPDGKYLATVGHTRAAKVWDVTKGKEAKEVSSFVGHQTSVFCVAFHPTGEYLASGDSDGKVKLWHRATGREIPTSEGHGDFVSGLAFSLDGRYLASASWTEVIVWDVTNLDNLKKLRTFDRLTGRITWVVFSPGGKRLAAAIAYKGKGEIKIWDAALWENKP
jgi:WD40 repeat protein/serine/threonine protein kinase